MIRKGKYVSIGINKEEKIEKINMDDREEEKGTDPEAEKGGM